MSSCETVPLSPVIIENRGPQSLKETSTRLFLLYGGDCPRWALGTCDKKTYTFPTSSLGKTKSLVACEFGLHRNIERPTNNVAFCNRGWMCGNQLCKFFHGKENLTQDCTSFSLGKGCQNPLCVQRHIFSDRGEQVCGKWKTGLCFNVACRKRHPIREIMIQADCYHFHGPEGCTFEENCALRHKKRSKVQCEKWVRDGICSVDCDLYHSCCLSKEFVNNLILSWGKKPVVNSSADSVDTPNVEILVSKVTAPTKQLSERYKIIGKQKKMSPEKIKETEEELSENRASFLTKICECLVKLAKTIHKCDKLDSINQNGIFEACCRSTELLNQRHFKESAVQVRIICEYITGYLFEETFKESTPQTLLRMITQLKHKYDKEGETLSENSEQQSTKNIKDIINLLNILNSKVRASTHSDSPIYSEMDMIEILSNTYYLMDNFVRYLIIVKLDNDIGDALDKLY